MDTTVDAPDRLVPEPELGHLQDLEINQDDEFDFDIGGDDAFDLAGHTGLEHPDLMGQADAVETHETRDDESYMYQSEDHGQQGSVTDIYDGASADSQYGHIDMAPFGLDGEVNPVQNTDSQGQADLDVASEEEMLQNNEYGSHGEAYYGETIAVSEYQDETAQYAMLRDFDLTNATTSVDYVREENRLQEHIHDADQNDTDQNDANQDDANQSDADQNDADQNDADQNDADQNDADQNDADQNDADQDDADQNDAGQNDADQNDAETFSYPPPESPTTRYEVQDAEYADHTNITALATDDKDIQPTDHASGTNLAEHEASDEAVDASLDQSNWNEGEDEDEDEDGDHINAGPIVTVSYAGQEYSMFAQSPGDNPDTYFLDKVEYARLPLSQFFVVLRSVISSEVEDSQELFMRINGLGLAFSESTANEFLAYTSLAEIIAVNDRLTQNDGGSQHAELYIFLSVRSSPLRLFNELAMGAEEGRGLSYFEQSYEPSADASAVGDEEQEQESTQELPGEHDDATDAMTDAFTVQPYANPFQGNDEQQPGEGMFPTMTPNAEAEAAEKGEIAISQNSHLLDVNGGGEESTETGEATEVQTEVPIDNPEEGHDGADDNIANMATDEDYLDLGDDDGTRLQSTDQATINGNGAKKLDTQRKITPNSSETGTLNEEENYQGDEVAVYQPTTVDSSHALNETIMTEGSPDEGDEIDWNHDEDDQVGDAVQNPTGLSPSSLSVKRGRQEDEAFNGLGDDAAAKRRRT